jgi:serine/threonine-protein kinase ULK4
VLPVLAGLYRASKDGDRRFMCLKVFCDTLLLLLDSTSPLPQTPSSHTPPQQPVDRAQIEALVFQHFLPLYPALLQDEEPIPTYAQKLLALLLDRQCVRVPDLIQLKLLPRLFDFLEGSPETINSYALKLCRAAISAPEVLTRALSEARVCARLGLLLQEVAGQGKDDFVEPVVAICRGFLERHAGGGAGIQARA